MSMRSCLLVMALIASTSACSKKETTVTTDQGKVTVSQDGNKATIKDNKGSEMKIEQGKLPDNFPKDVPIYPGAIATMNAADPKAAMVTLRSDASKDEIAKYYTDELKGQGWKIQASTDLGGLFTMIAVKEQRRCTVTVTADQTQKGNTIAITFEGNVSQ